MKARVLFINTIYFLFIAMFLYAAVSKWMIFNVYVSQINKQPFDDKYTPLLVWGLPISEILVAILMMIDPIRRIGMMIGTGMMIAFTIYIIIIQLKFFGKIPCSCGGAITEFTWTEHLYFNLFFVITGVIVLLITRKKKI